MFNSAEEAKRALDHAASEQPERWVATVQTVILSLFVQLDKMKSILGNHHVALQKFHGDLQAVAQSLSPEAPQQVAPQTVAEQPAGDPADQAQLEAEALMNAAAGPRAGEQPQPVAAQPRRRRSGPPAVRGPAPVVPMQQVAGPPSQRRGADGSPLDPAQLAAEEAMDAATEGLPPHPAVGG